MTARLAPTRNASACMGCGYWRDGTPAPLRGATVTSTVPSASVARRAPPGPAWRTRRRALAAGVGHQREPAPQPRAGVRQFQVQGGAWEPLGMLPQAPPQLLRQL